MVVAEDRLAHWDFFISYTQADLPWAEWIAWLLEEDGHRVLIQAWDFVAGSNWVKSMHDGTTKATRTIAVLSRAYLNSVTGRPNGRRPGSRIQAENSGSFWFSE